MQNRVPMGIPVIGAFGLVMITLGAVDSIRSISVTAIFGSSLVFFSL